MLSVYLMYRRFARAFTIAAQDEGFIQIFGAGVLLVIVGTLTYTTSQGWSLINGFYFAIATLTTSSIADPSLTIESGWIKAFTVLYILIGIGILVELARQVGFAFVEVHRQEQAARQAKKDAKHHAEPAYPPQTEAGHAGVSPGYLTGSACVAFAFTSSTLPGSTSGRQAACGVEVRLECDSAVATSITMGRSLRSPTLPLSRARGSGTVGARRESTSLQG